MLIKDLEISKELTGAELSAVRGGNVTNAAAVGGYNGYTQQSGGAFFGAVSNTNVGVNAPQVGQYGIDYHPESYTNLALFGSIAAMSL